MKGIINWKGKVKDRKTGSEISRYLKKFLKPKKKKFNACTLKKSVGPRRKSVRSDLTLDFTTLGNGSETAKLRKRSKKKKG